MRRINIGVERASLIDLIDELYVIRAAVTAAHIVFHSPSFYPDDKHKAALSELLTTVENKVDELCEFLNADLERRRGEGGAV